MQQMFRNLTGSVPRIRVPVSTGLPRFAPKPTEQIQQLAKPTISQKGPTKPLSEPIELSKYTVPLYDPSTTPQLKLTTLPNGLRVVTLGGAALLSSAGVFIQSGSRLEGSHNSGVSHLFERMAFKSTSKRPVHENVNLLERAGVNLTSSSTRETLTFSAEFGHQHLPTVMELFGNNFTCPIYDPHEIEEQKQVMAFEIDDGRNNPAHMNPELIHAAAYGNSTLGMPLLPSMEGLDRLDQKALQQYTKQHIVGPRVVVAGVGVDHDELVGLTKQHLGTLPTSNVGMSGWRFHYPPANYQSGFTSASYEPKDGQKDVQFVSFAFRAPSWHDQRMYASCLLQLVLGGGNSFSSGGPGKGMYARLYGYVLAHDVDFDSAQAFYSAYEDDAIFGVTCSAPAKKLNRLCGLVSQNLQVLCQRYVSQEELMRAKSMLKSSLMMNLEMRSIQLEDIGRQHITYGKRELPAETCAKIDSITERDLAMVARDIISTPLSMSVLGDPTNIKPLEFWRSQFFFTA